MAKKRFIEGLDDLFSTPLVEHGRTEAEPRGQGAERRHAHKNFMADLDSLLQEALDESLSRLESTPPPDAVSQSVKSKSSGDPYPAPMSGLDALIRQTIDIREIESDENAGKKRLTVSVDRAKLEKLKTIAKLENSYIKDLLVRALDQYIEAYKQRKGLDL